MPCVLSSYYQIFLKGHMYRENCYACRYACGKRVSDITIGDFWGVEKEHPELLENYDISKGISCILVNTDKGKKLLSTAEDLVLFESTFDKAARANGQLNHPSTPGMLRKVYKTLYSTKGYDAVDQYFKLHEISPWRYIRWQLSKIKRFLINFRLKKH